MFKFSKRFISLFLALLMLTMTAIGVNAEELITGTAELLVGLGVIEPSPEEELMPMAAGPCLSGTSKLPETAQPNATYTQYDADGNIYSYAAYNANGKLISRIDYLGATHYIKNSQIPPWKDQIEEGEYLPHIHYYTYNGEGQCNGKYVYPYN